MPKTIRTIILAAWTLWALFWAAAMPGLLIWDQLTTRGIHAPGGWFILAMASFALGVSAIVAAILGNPQLK